MARGAGGAGAAAGAADGVEEAELAPGVAAGADPQALELPKASPATTHGVVSELI